MRPLGQSPPEMSATSRWRQVGRTRGLRIINLALMLLTLGAVFALYAIKYDACQREGGVQMQEHDVEKLENHVAVLVAERAHLARPKALEPLARSLGLAPIAPRQYLRLEGPPAADPGRRNNAPSHYQRRPPTPRA